MAKVRNRLLILFASVFLLAIGVFALSACNGSGDYTVTFYVQNEAGEWQQNGQPVEVGSDGTVELPNDPSKTFYTFRGWYDNTEFSGEKFTGEDVTKDMKVYACFVPDTAEAFINGESQGEKNLADIVNGTYEPGKNLEFDGWYTDSNYGTKWDEKTDTDVLYARSVARITFYDGYQTLAYSPTVEPGKTLTDPADDKNGSKGNTVEKDDIVQYYMSDKSIKYVDENGDEFNFSEPITENTTITVLWYSPFINVALNSNTNSYYVRNLTNTESAVSCSEVPVISIQSYYVDENGNELNVETISATGFLLLSANITEKVIIGDGIKCIIGLSSSSNGNCPVSEIVLPDSVKIIDGSFNFLPNLQTAIIPDGVEVVINSFWKSENEISDMLAEYDFEIAVPDSVINLSRVPSNLTFSKTAETAESGDFYKDEQGRIYKNDNGKKLLIADYNVVSGRLEVEDGVQGIQVGAFIGMDIDYLVLPSSWSYVGYNELASKYTYYNKTGRDCKLWNSEWENNPGRNCSVYAYSIYNMLTLPFNSTVPEQAVVCVMIDQSDYPTDISSYALCGDSTGMAMFMGYEPYTKSMDKFVFTGEGSEKVTISINVTNWMTEEENAYSVEKDITKNDIFTLEDFLSATSLKDLYDDGKISVTAVTELGEDYEWGTKITRNLYLDVTIEYNMTGVTFDYDDTALTATVTGFDADTAYKYDNLYLVDIPETVGHNGKTYTVVAIADHAFDTTQTNGTNANDLISSVFIPKTVKTIGAYAFYNCANLTKVYIAPGGLETIGEHAFEGCGFETIALPLSNLKEVGAYAFKSESLKKFLTIDGEENRGNFNLMNNAAASEFLGSLKEGMFFYVEGNTGLVKFKSKTTENGLDVYDVQFIAVAGGAKADLTGCPNFNIGISRQYWLNSQSYQVIRYEVMEGSVYYLTNYEKIVFGLVSKVHEGAFSNINTSKIAVEVYNSSKNEGTDLSSITAVASANYDFTSADAVFEDGWFNGIYVDNPDYETLMAIFANAKKTSKLESFDV